MGSGRPLPFSHIADRRRHDQHGERNAKRTLMDFGFRAGFLNMAVPCMVKLVPK